MPNPFPDTPALCGPLRRPRQMLADQRYDGHKSIHDDAMAEKLGLRAGPIEGPTHFSQFDPLLYQLYGQAWFETAERILNHAVMKASYAAYDREAAELGKP